MVCACIGGLGTYRPLLLHMTQNAECRLPWACPPQQELLVYVELLETRRQYICNLTPMW